jgi:signal transduction histidine kinase
VEIHAAAIGNSTAPAEGRMIVEVIRDLGQEVRFSHEQRLASLGQLAAGVAHEIRNPLSSIKIALHALLHADPDRIARDAETKHYLELVEGQVDICVQVTEKLLRLSLYSDGAAELMDVNRAVSETASLMAYESEKAGVRTDIRLHPQGLRIMAAEGDIRMALLNLLQNALHAMPRGGVLSLATREEEGWAVIDVVDTGVGMSSEVQQHVFEPFFSRRADGQKGTGLGLAIARSLVSRHGGMIEMESEVGKGSRFTMRFPTAEKHLASIVKKDEA